MTTIPRPPLVSRSTDLATEEVPEQVTLHYANWLAQRRKAYWPSQSASDSQCWTNCSRPK